MTQPSRVRIWLVSGGAGLLLLAAILLLFGAPDTVAPTARKLAGPALPPVELKRAGERAPNPLFREETILRDPTPLFLPTRWNAADDALAPVLQREPGTSFSNYPARLNFPETNLVLDLPPPVLVPGSPVDSLVNEKSDRPYLGFGAVDRTPSVLPARAAYVRVVAAGDGQLMISQPLTDAKPPGEAGWQPLELVVAIDPSGVVRPPVLTESSRVAAVDGYFQRFIVQTLHVGENLPPGVYRVYIGP